MNVIVAVVVLTKCNNNFNECYHKHESDTLKVPKASIKAFTVIRLVYIEHINFDMYLYFKRHCT